MTQPEHNQCYRSDLFFELGFELFVGERLLDRFEELFSACEHRFKRLGRLCSAA